MAALDLVRDAGEGISDRELEIVSLPISTLQSVTPDVTPEQNIK